MAKSRGLTYHQYCGRDSNHNGMLYALSHYVSKWASQNRIALELCPH